MNWPGVYNKPILPSEEVGRHWGSCGCPCCLEWLAPISPLVTMWAPVVDERDGGRATKNASCREFEDLVFASLEECPAFVRFGGGKPILYQRISGPPWNAGNVFLYQQNNTRFRR